MNHQCMEFLSSSPVPQDWRATLGCQQCKKTLVTYIASEMLKLSPALLKLSPPYLQQTQTIIANVGIQAFRVTANGSKMQDEALNSDADEADLKVWLHCQMSSGKKKLIFSPDTDIYHIGLTVVKTMPDAEIIVQTGKMNTDSQKFVHLNYLLQALATDPDCPITSPDTANFVCSYWM